MVKYARMALKIGVNGPFCSKSSVEFGKFDQKIFGQAMCACLILRTFMKLCTYLLLVFYFNMLKLNKDSCTLCLTFLKLMICDIVHFNTVFFLFLL